MKNSTVAILLATYNPPESWLCELLDSLNAQSYPHLHLYVRDDASTSITPTRLEVLLREHITRFPYTLFQNERNLGSNATFSALVTDCHEPYVAFCDQDDVWLPKKIENTLELLWKSPLAPVMVCTNVRVIDNEGNELAPTITEHRRRHVLLRGNNLTPTLIHRNFALGCTMVMKRERLLTYLPFPKEAVHDHYIAFRASTEGAIDYLDEPQMLYRVYGQNQTEVMAGVATKEDYFNRRILRFAARVDFFCRLTEHPELTRTKEWSEARSAFFKHEKGSLRKLWRLRDVDAKTTLFELVVLRLPKPLFSFMIRLVQKGIL